MYTVEAIYDGVNFKPTQPITAEGQYKVSITFLEQVAEVKPKRPLSELFGLWEGDIWIADDHDWFAPMFIDPDELRGLLETMHLQSIPGMVESIKEAQEAPESEWLEDIGWDIS